MQTLIQAINKILAGQSVDSVIDEMTTAGSVGLQPVKPMATMVRPIRPRRSDELDKEDE